MKKKIFLIAMLMLSIVVLFACSMTNLASESDATSVVSTTEQITIPRLEDIKIDSKGYWENQWDWDFEAVYRLVYYTLPGYLEDMVNDLDNPDAHVFVDWLAYEGDRDVMMIMVYVERYNIPKDVFTAAVSEYIAITVQNDWDPTEEGFEPPNPDIIYTFDNEIINAYYRRENPVVPDWSKTKTYESYEEYLEANE